MENHEMTDPKELEQKTEPHSLTDGQRIQDSGSGAVYLIDQGKKRWIPDWETYDDLFLGRLGITVDHNLLRDIPEAPMIPPGACLVRPEGYQPIYFIDGEQTRHVKSEDAMRRYQFNSKRIYSAPAVFFLYRIWGPDIE